jgi:NAD-dependent dihydropyrimidine dehydrogenase PreA subunit
MVKHIVAVEKCRGCGKCVDICSLELWELVDAEGGRKRAQVIDEAGSICHACLCCRDACPEDAITIIQEE